MRRKDVLTSLAPRLVRFAALLLLPGWGCDRGTTPDNQDGGATTATSRAPSGAPSGSQSPASQPAPAQPHAAGDAAQPALAQPLAAGDAARGAALVKQFECNRCHNLPGDDNIAERNKSCTGCHQWILDGAPLHEDAVINPTAVHTWQSHLRTMKYLPSLAAGFYRREWIERFLIEPYDLRPNLPASMPRLNLTKEQARDIAAFIGEPGAAAPNDAGAARDSASLAEAALLDGAEPARGQALFLQKGCVTCHVFTTAPSVAAPAPAPAPKSDDATAPLALAPDLRHARDKYGISTLLTWIKSPDWVKRVRPNMPTTPMTADEARDIAAYLMKAEIAPLAAPARPARLPPLNRKVTYDEVAANVFRKTCRHCHAEPDEALGEGGPGNTGGFGFAPRGLVLAEYEGIAAGSLNDQNERRSVFAKTSDGTPLLIRALLARQAEEAGHPDPEVRGMPLGIPSLTPEQLQLVETWVAQDHPR